MIDPYAEHVGLFKALSDANRLMIVDMLSCGEFCGCKILERFRFTQPTLSHHMKILCNCGLVRSRKVGKLTYYSLNGETVGMLKDFLRAITTGKEKCIWREGACDGESSL